MNEISDYQTFIEAVGSATPTGIWFLCDENGNSPMLDHMREAARKDEQLRQTVFNITMKADEKK